MMALCLNWETCGGVNPGYGWFWTHRFNVAVLKKHIDFRHSTHCTRCRPPVADAAA